MWARGPRCALRRTCRHSSGFFGRDAQRVGARAPAAEPVRGGGAIPNHIAAQSERKVRRGGKLRRQATSEERSMNAHRRRPLRRMRLLDLTSDERCVGVRFRVKASPMPSALDQRIDGFTDQLADLRRRASEIEREAGILEIKLEAFREARLLLQEDHGSNRIADVSKPSHDLFNGADQPNGTLPSGRPSRLSETWRELLGFALRRYPATITNQEFSEEADRLGTPIIRNNLRSALWTHAKNELLEKVDTGVHRITENGARAIGCELPKSLEAESVERNPAPLSASHEPPLEGLIRQTDAHKRRRGCTQAR